jgi:hypothetical protein
MNRLIRSCLFATAVVLSLPPASAAAATIVQGTFQATFDTGSLAGTTFKVAFSYDADQVQSDGFVGLRSIDFTLGGAVFNRTFINQGGQLIFHNGALDNITASFQGQMPAGSPVSNVTFGFGGPGVIGYINHEGQFGHGVFQVLWRSMDVGAGGALGPTGSAVQQDGVWTMTGAGNDVWNSSDAFHYVFHETTSSSGRLLAHVTTPDPTNIFAKAGLMLRSSVDPSAAAAILDLKPSGEIEFMARPGAGSSMQYLAGAWATSPAWLMLEWSNGPDGLSVSGSMSDDGRSWTPVGAAAVSTTGTTVVGAVVCSHDVSALSSTRVDGLSVVPASALTTDVGTASVPGDVVGADVEGPITLSGSGADIWGTVDGFRIAYGASRGMDLTFQAEVIGQENTDVFAKVGLMIRERLDDDAAFVILDRKPSGELEWMMRPFQGQPVQYLGGLPPGYGWLRVRRSGAAVAGYASSDGSQWIQIGTVILPPTAAEIVGVVVSSHDAGHRGDGVIRHVTVVSATP